MGEPVWQYLQISDALDQEFASALSQSVQVVAWQPVMSHFAVLGGHQTEQHLLNPPLLVRTFPLQKGYWRKPLSWLLPTAKQVVDRLTAQKGILLESPLICSTPYYAPVSERWPGPVVYYLTDRIAEYAGTDPKLVRALDRRLCSRADLICPNSQRLADYLMSEAACPPAKIRIVPNATRAANISAEPLFSPAPLPADAADLPRPIAGVIGNMADNLDWLVLKTIIEGTPAFSWLLVGPVDMEIPDLQERKVRSEILQMGGRVRFVGRKAYGDLASYARSFDVAVLPYKKREPTYSGSSTRFYEHLAACRPIVSTRGFEELLHKEPLLQLIDNGQQGIDLLESLRARGFQDGQTEARWLASREATWEGRAATMKSALEHVRYG